MEEVGEESLLRALLMLWNFIINELLQIIVSLLPWLSICGKAIRLNIMFLSE